MAEKTLRPSDKELMKMAMLRHEETFKQQVNELHRLYQVQRIMMNDMETRRPQEWRGEICFRQNNQRKKPQLKQAAEEYILNESEIQLTLGPSSSSRFPRTKSPTQQVSYSGQSFSSSSTESSHIFRAFNGHEMGIDNSLGYQNRKTSDVEEKMRQERLRQPPWVFQIVSL